MNVGILEDAAGTSIEGTPNAVGPTRVCDASGSRPAAVAQTLAQESRA